MRKLSLAAVLLAASGTGALAQGDRLTTTNPTTTTRRTTAASGTTSRRTTSRRTTSRRTTSRRTTSRRTTSSGTTANQGLRPDGLPLTDLELQPAHRHSTANLFGLPPYYHYRIGSCGFGSWRELEAHRMTTEWVWAPSPVNTTPSRRSPVETPVAAKKV